MTNFVQTWYEWSPVKLKIVSSFKLDPQGIMITTGTHFVKKTLLLYVFIMLSGEPGFEFNTYLLAKFKLISLIASTK